MRANTNERVNTMAGGIVRFSGWDSGGGGEMIIVEHSNGFRSLYMHLNRRDVSAGTQVVAGQQIGGAGTTGTSTGVHLHFEIRYGTAQTTAVNPLHRWNRDDSRYPNQNPNSVFLLYNGIFVANPLFDWAHVSCMYTRRLSYLSFEYTETISPRHPAFYQIDGHIINLVSHKEWIEFRDTILVGVADTDTMPLVRFIQHFNISREMLESAVEQMHESDRLPNLDIIFTFDNEIVNLYYLQ